MKKKILSVLLTASFIMGIIDVNASNIVYEESINEETFINEMDITPLMATTDIATYADSNGTLEFVKTIQGNGYTAVTRKSNEKHYWSVSTGSSFIFNDYINLGNGAVMEKYTNFGSTSAEYVPLFSNIYLPKGSVVHFVLYGISCGHVGSNADVYISDGTNTINVGNMKVPLGSNGSPVKTVTLNYKIVKSGNYSAKAIGVALECITSAGHGIYILSSYDIYRYRYDLNYNLNGGSLTKENPVCYYEENDDITLKNPVKEGYTFLGWTGSNLSVPSTNVTIPAGSIGNKNYIANWQINQYPVTYIDKDINGNEIGRTTKLIDYDATVKGSDIGDDETDNAYYPQYRYVSDTSAKVTTNGTIVYRVFELCETEAKSNLQWNDNNDADGFRPEKYKLKLKQNGKIIDEIELLSDTTNYTFPNLPKYDENGTPYQYTFDVDASERYNIRFDDNGNLIVEDYLPANFSVTIPKQIVLDGNTGKADYQITVNGVFYYNDTLTVQPENNFIMNDKSNLQTLDANVFLNKTTFTKEDNISEGSNSLGSIQTERIIFPGSWSGSFNFDIKFVMQN